MKLAHNAMLERSSGPPCRPDFGTRGQTVRLRANHFPVHSIPEALYEYNVKITPRNLPRHTVTRIYQLAEQTTTWGQAGMVGTVAHDSASRLVSSEPLPHPLEIQVRYYGEGSPLSEQNTLCTLTIAFVKVLDMGNLIGFETIHYPTRIVLNLLLDMSRGYLGFGITMFLPLSPLLISFSSLLVEARCSEGRIFQPLKTPQLVWVVG